MWLLGRAIVTLAFAYAAPGHVWESFGHWDGAWYRDVALNGYSYAPDGLQHNVAFFPVYPICIALLAKLGIPALVAAVAVNNIAMLLALLLVFAYVEGRVGRVAARWTCAVVALYPMALFTTVAYSEGLFLLATALALVAYDRGRWATCGVAGLVATAVRPTGVALAAAFALVGIAIRRIGPLAAGIVACAGIGAFALYCFLRFGDPLAFVHVQHAWRGNLGFSVAPWYAILQMGFAQSKMFGHAIALIALVSALRLKRVDAVTLSLGAVFACTEAQLWSYNASAATLLVFGGAGVFVFRKKLGATAVLYAVFAVAMLVAGGTPFSIDRNAYAVLPFAIAVGLLAQKFPAIGYPSLAVMAWGLAFDAAQFARGIFVA